VKNTLPQKNYGTYERNALGEVAAVFTDYVNSTAFFRVFGRRKGAVQNSHFATAPCSH
jgi:hypothetical protein